MLATKRLVVDPHIYMGKGKIAPDVEAEPIGTGNGEVATDAGASSTGSVGKVVIPPSKSTVGTGESSGAMGDTLTLSSSLCSSSSLSSSSSSSSSSSFPQSQSQSQKVDLPVAGAGLGSIFSIFKFGFFSGEGSTGVGKVVVPPGKGTVGTGDFSGASDDKVDPEAKTSGMAEEEKNKSRCTERIEKQQTVPVYKIKARTIAERMYDCKCSKLDEIQKHVDDVIEEERGFFAPVEAICPNVNVLFARVLLNQFRRNVKNINGTLQVGKWGEKECKDVGRSFAVFIRKRKTGDVALDAWRRHFVHLKKLFDEVDGFEELMLVLANNLLRDR